MACLGRPKNQLKMSPNRRNTALCKETGFNKSNADGRIFSHFCSCNTRMDNLTLAITRPTFSCLWPTYILPISNSAVVSKLEDFMKFAPKSIIHKKAVTQSRADHFSNILADHDNVSADCYLFTVLNSGLLFGHGRPYQQRLSCCFLLLP